MVAGAPRIGGGDCARNLPLPLVGRIHSGECESRAVVLFESWRVVNDCPWLGCSRTIDRGVSILPAASDDGGLEYPEGANR